MSYTSFDDQFTLATDYAVAPSHANDALSYMAAFAGSYSSVKTAAQEIAEHFAAKYPVSVEPVFTHDQITRAINNMVSRANNNGSFVETLGELLIRADSVNTAKLVAAFPELIKRFSAQS